MKSRIMNEKLKILELNGTDVYSWLSVGDTWIDSRVIASIEPYEERGEMAPVIWFEVKDEHGDPIGRINSKYVSIIHYGGVK